jgi:hypothetical protein
MTKHPVPMLGMSGAISLLIHTLSKLVKGKKILPCFVIMFMWKRKIYMKIYMKVKNIP